uniref:DNA endonuclease activator Ctp1 C-terminal domain-containing protein n=1 Tax=Eutreptiella gymnastica TaxID=73025 RepID=A0A7S4G876_9EUGL
MEAEPQPPAKTPGTPPGPPDDATQPSPGAACGAAADSETCCTMLEAPQQMPPVPSPRGPSQDTAAQLFDSYKSPPCAYKHRQVVRGKAARQQLKGHESKCMAKFFDAVGVHGSSREALVQATSRHRFARGHTPPPTPEGFWNLDLFESPTQSAKRPKVVPRAERDGDDGTAQRLDFGGFGRNMFFLERRSVPLSALEGSPWAGPRSTAQALDHGATASTSKP